MNWTIMMKIPNKVMNMTTKHLSPEPARALTSREIAKVISGNLGSFLGWCDPDDIRTAVEHIAANIDNYYSFWKQQDSFIRTLSVNNDTKH